MGLQVAILGASQKPERFSYKAFEMLRSYGHTPIPVSPKFKELKGIAAFANLSEIKTSVDTLIMYVSTEISSGLQDQILALKPRRVIFNPGSENPELAAVLNAAGIQVVEACTLVLLRTGQFSIA